MAENVYHFTIGDMQCIALREGSAGGRQASTYFANAPEDELKQVLKAHRLKADDMSTSFNVLYIDTGEHRLIVDTGVGPNPEPTLGNTFDLLESEGIDRGDIDIVIITHAHGDHIGGLADDNQQPYFPNAKVIMWRGEWDYWTSEDMLATPRGDAIRAKLLPMKDRMRFVDTESDIVPGICPIYAPGHTPGHMALLLESRGDRLLHIVDAAHQLIQLERPEWSPSFDSQPDISPVTRHSLFDRAARQNLLVMAYHFPFPGVGRITVDGDIFVWNPES